MITRKAFLTLVFSAALVRAEAGNTEPLEANAATEAQLDSVLGIGPGLSRRILAERAQKPFDDWSDLIRRVTGIGPKSARKLSRQGLRVKGLAYEEAAAETPPETPTAD